MAKPDSVYLTCRCGVMEAVGTYYSRDKAPHEGWDPEHWRLHGWRKANECAKRWQRHVIRLHKLWDRALARRAAKAGRTFEEQHKWEQAEATREHQAWWAKQTEALSVRASDAGRTVQEQADLEDFPL
jgi:hypothetical protein